MCVRGQRRLVVEDEDARKAVRVGGDGDGDDEEGRPT
jgi:hypothetical protein